MSEIQLNKDFHALIENCSEDGLVLITDIRDNSVFQVPDSLEIRKFINLSSNISPKISSDIQQQEDLFAIHNNPETDNISTSSSGDHAVWEHSAVMLLFSLWKDHSKLFKSDKIRNEVVWKKIAEHLKEKGYIHTAKQVENKWKNLRKCYIKVKNNNSKSGASFKTCKYYKEMEEIYSKSHSVLPVAIASNLSENITSISSTEESKSDEDNAPPPKKVKKEKQIETWMEQYEKKSQQREEERERRHKEKMEYQKEALDTYKSIMNKLLEKM